VQAIENFHFPSLQAGKRMRGSGNAVE
jgi:hypothetical protein